MEAARRLPRNETLPARKALARNAAKALPPSLLHSLLRLLLDRHALPIGHAPKAEPLHQWRVTVKRIALLLLVSASLLSTNVAAQETNAPAPR
jgi:hypothetical protein